MQANWINTRRMYHDIIAAPDAETREQRYSDSILRPWEQLMSMVTGGATSADPFAGARAWHWLVPEQLTDVPASLMKLEAAHAWERGAAAMQRAVQHFAPYAGDIPLDRIEGWLLLADPATFDPVMRGYTGATDWLQPRFIVQYSEPNEYNLPRLEGAIVHEMHHLIRYKVAPWNIAQATLDQYIIHEGLAESFAKALYGEQVVGYYVTEVDDEELATARALIGEHLQATGFDTLRAFVFGDHWAHKLGLPAVGMPDYGGYAVGYHVVQAYLQRTGNSIAAATFLPAEEIVAESGYFQGSASPA